MSNNVHNTDVGSFTAIAALVIFCLAIILTIFLVFKAIEIRIPVRGRQPFTLAVKYYVAPVVAVLAMLATTSMTIQDVGRGLLGNNQIQPYGILILFMSMAYIAGSLDASGVFAWLALKFTVMSGGRGHVLFLFYFLLSSFITTFTSNDVCILTLTPIVCYFAKATGVNPMPFLYAEYAAANTFGALLYTGNPTNIIVADAYNMTFLGYSKFMSLPTLAGGIACYIVLLIEFFRDIPKSIPLPTVDASQLLRDKLGAVFGSVNMLTCLALLAAAPSLGWTMWTITIVCAGVHVVYNLWAFRSSVLNLRPLLACWTCGCTKEEHAGGPSTEASAVGAAAAGACCELQACKVPRSGSSGSDRMGPRVGYEMEAVAADKAGQGKAFVRHEAALQTMGRDDVDTGFNSEAPQASRGSSSANPEAPSDSGCSGSGGCNVPGERREGCPCTPAGGTVANAARRGCCGATGSGSSPAGTYCGGRTTQAVPRAPAGPLAESVDMPAAALPPVTSVVLAADEDPVGSAVSPSVANPAVAASDGVDGADAGQAAMTVDSLRGKAPTFWGLFFDLPWEVVPFALGMFVLVEGLYVQGWLNVFGSGLGKGSETLPGAIFIMGFLSILLANTINNQPMTILLTRIALDPRYTSYVQGSTHKAALFSLVLGSNIGAVFTLIGALAGILWSNIMGIHGVKVTYAQFARICCPVGFVTLVASLLVLWFEFVVFPNTG